MPQGNDDMPRAWPEGTRRSERALRVTRKVSLAAYEWDELKWIARAIAEASCRAEGLAIARDFGLVDDEMRLGGSTKGVVLKDGTTASVRILGFRHDELASGAGMAGISFEFADVPITHRMNAHPTNKGGWYQSEMRDWLNTAFFEMLPHDLRLNIVEVKKRTSYRYWEWHGNDLRGGAFNVAETFDKLWLLSMPEVYGALPAHGRNVPPYPEVYNAEGLQYQLYADNDVSVTNLEFCRKVGADIWWWLRSPHVGNLDSFLLVLVVGNWHAYDANLGWGVSPGFCF